MKTFEKDQENSLMWQSGKWNFWINLPTSKRVKMSSVSAPDTSLEKERSMTPNIKIYIIGQFFPNDETTHLLKPKQSSDMLLNTKPKPGHASTLQSYSASANTAKHLLKALGAQQKPNSSTLCWKHWGSRSTGVNIPLQFPNHDVPKCTKNV